MVQAKKWAKASKRPLAVLYLSTPPKDFQALRDFRRLQGAEDRVLSPNLSHEIRSAHEQRQLALDYTIQWTILRATQKR